MAAADLTGKVPVVLVSANDEQDVVMKSLSLGAADYLVKPLRTNEFRHIWTRVFMFRRVRATLINVRCFPSLVLTLLFS